MEKDFWISIAIKFDLGVCPIQNRPICIERRKQRDDSAKWIVSMHEWCLTKKGEWICEPLPSSRTPSFIKRTRFDSKEDALKAYQSFVSKRKAQTVLLTK